MKELLIFLLGVICGGCVAAVFFCVISAARTKTFLSKSEEKDNK